MHAGLPEEAPGAALLLTCPRAGCRGPTCGGKGRTRVINISKGQMFPLSVWDRRSPTLLQLEGPFRAPQRCLVTKPTTGTRSFLCAPGAKEPNSKQGKQLCTSFSPPPAALGRGKNVCSQEL